MLDLEGIAVSIGSACNAGAIEPSHVLTAIGLSKKDSLSSLRFSLGKFTTQKEIDHTLKVLSKILSKTKPSNF
jgi:cysteine desulfurase